MGAHVADPSDEAGHPEPFPRPESRDLPEAPARRGSARPAARRARQAALAVLGFLALAGLTGRPE